jgi:hypothetical protein
MATLNIVLDKRNKLENDKYHLTIRVCSGRKVMYLRVGASLKVTEFEKIFVKKTYDKSIEAVKLKFDKCLERAKKIYDHVKPFDQGKFRELYYDLKFDTDNIISDEKLKSGSIKCLYDNYIKNKLESGQIRLSTADNYKYDMRSLLSYSPTLYYQDITPEFLNSFENWYVRKKENNKKNSLASLGCILRSLRCVLKYHIKKKIIPNTYEYPFLDYKIPNLVPPKIVISNTEIEKIINNNYFKDVWEEYARDIWITLYRLNGMNFIDLLKLTWEENITGEYLIYVRHKTERTRRNNIRPIRIRITEKIQSMLDKIGDKNSPFIFGLMNKEDYDETYLKNRNKKLKVKINKYLRIIGKRLNLSMSLDISLARDSYANTLKRANVNPLKISENMNHSDPRTTTLHYLDNFNQETLDEANEVVL